MDYEKAVMSAVMRELNNIPDSGVKLVLKKLIADNKDSIDWKTVSSNLQKHVKGYRLGPKEESVERPILVQE